LDGEQSSCLSDGRRCRIPLACVEHFNAGHFTVLVKVQNNSKLHFLWPCQLPSGLVSSSGTGDTPVSLDASFWEQWRIILVRARRLSKTIQS
jgi:hypothetical protein